MTTSYGGRRIGLPGGPAHEPAIVVCILVRMAVRTNLLLPEDLVREVDRIAGPRNRSRFFAEAAAAKLKRERLRQAFEQAAGIAKAEDYPHWATSEDVVAWVRELRAEETSPPTEDDSPDARRP